MGWSVLVVWECQLKDKAKLSRRLHAFLRAPEGYSGLNTQALK